jgi:hypothetical protein
MSKTAVELSVTTEYKYNTGGRCGGTGSTAQNIVPAESVEG